MGRLIDAHIHLWDPHLRHHDWLKAVPDLDRRFGPEDADFGSEPPDALIFVEADCRPGEALSEVAWVNSLSPTEPPIAGIVAHAPLERGVDVARDLALLGERPRVVGVRRLLQGETRSLLASDALVQGTQLLPRYGLVSDLCVTFEQIPAVTALVKRCGETGFILDHVGKPPIAAPEESGWFEDLRDLARCQNVACKLSGLTTIAPSRADAAEVLPYLRQAIEVFGPERCMFGSDWPVSLQGTTYESWVEIVRQAIDGLSRTEQDAVLGETAMRVYGLDLPHRAGTTDSHG